MIETRSDSESTATTTTSAARAAAHNASANLRALRESQPDVAADLHSPPANVEWVYARDGALSALEGGHKWWAGCSLPARAAEFMLKKADLEGTVLCFLWPQHAAQLRVTLDRAKPGQALLALIPDLTTLHMVLACDDFSAEIDSHRLYVVAGEQWEAQLDQLFERLPGLPTPTQFVRPILADSSSADAMISPAQKIFAEHSNRRSMRVRGLRQDWKSTGLRRICVVAPALFRLWDDAGFALAGAMKSLPKQLSTVRFNPDDPASASAAALAAAAAACDAIVAPNTGRADLPDLLPDEMPWATWLTMPRIPSVDGAGLRDTLLVADPAWKEMAIEKGWMADRIFIARWPVVSPGVGSSASAVGPGVFRVPHNPMLAIISDTHPLDPPERIIEYSSHRLLWESIQHELFENPFALGESPDAYLADGMKRARIEEEGFDRGAFVDGVVLHAWQQGIARLLLREQLPVKLYGQGWDQLDDFRAHAAGPVLSRAELDVAVSSAAALVHAWPMPYAHAIEATGKPVIRARRKQEAFIRDARSALAGRYAMPKPQGEILTSAVVVRALSFRDATHP